MVDTFDIAGTEVYMEKTQISGGSNINDAVVIRVT